MYVSITFLNIPYSIINSNRYSRIPTLLTFVYGHTVLKFNAVHNILIFADEQLLRTLFIHNIQKFMWVRKPKRKLFFPAPLRYLYEILS